MRFSCISGRVGVAFFVVVIVGLVGCFESESTLQLAATTGTGSASGLSPDLAVLQRQWESGDVAENSRRLWSDVQENYTKINRYSDQAQVQLSYELLGNVMFETMPVSLAFDRSSKQWQCQVFRAMLFGDSRHIVMTIKEASTNHLDRQVKLSDSRLGASHLGESDPVARIYLSGATDIPLSESSINRLVLCAPQLEWLNARGWKTTYGTTPTTGTLNAVGGGSVSTQNTKLENVIVYRGWTIHNDNICVKLAQPFRGGQTEYWIDVEEKLIRKMIFDNAVLSSELAGTPEVRGLSLQIEFGEIAVDQQARPPLRFKDFPVDRTVRNFVKIPEAFPSPWIGRRSPEINLKTRERKSLRLPATGCPTIAVFLSQIEANAAWWLVLETAAKAPELNTATITMVLDGIETTSTTTPVAQWTLDSPSPQLVSHGAEAWQTLGLSQGRWLVIWDTKGIVQYVGAADRDGLSDTIVTILQRLSRGESIGEEMIAEYQSFYSQYLDQLQAQQVTELPN